MPQDKPTGKNKNTNDLENDLVPLTLRIPREVHRKLKGISDKEYRSLNHQIIMALSYFIDMHDKLGGLPHPDYLKKALPGGSASFQAWLVSQSTSMTGRGAK